MIRNLIKYSFAKLDGILIERSVHITLSHQTFLNNLYLV